MAGGVDVTKKTVQLSRKEREEAFRRELVLDVAEGLFAAKGFAGTTVSDIAEKSELAKGSLYHLFKSKEEIIEAIIWRKVAGVSESVSNIISETGSPLAKIMRIMQFQFQHIWESRHFARIFLHELRGFHWIMKAPAKNELKKHIEDFREQLILLIADAQKQGEIRKDLSPNLVEAALAGFSNAVLFDWLTHEKINLETAEVQFKDIFLSGVGVKK